MRGPDTKDAHGGMLSVSVVSQDKPTSTYLTHVKEFYAYTAGVYTFQRG